MWIKWENLKPLSNKRKIAPTSEKTATLLVCFFATEIWDSLLECTLKLWSTLLDGWLCKSLKKPQLTYGTSWGTKELLTGKKHEEAYYYFSLFCLWTYKLKTCCMPMRYLKNTFNGGAKICYREQITCRVHWLLKVNNIRASGS